MSAFNKVILLGNLTRDPELRYTPKGVAVCAVSLAVNRKWRSEAGEEKEEVCFVEVKLFGRTAETCAQYVKKGSPLLVEGRLCLDQWEDKQTGNPRSKLYVAAQAMQFIGTGKREEVSPRPTQQRTLAAQVKEAGQAEGEYGPPEDDVPF